MSGTAHRSAPTTLALLPLLPPLLPLLLPLLLPSFLPCVQGCMETVLQRGTMSDSELVVPELRVDGSCVCCALCHHQPSCASLSFHSGSSACRLYRTVPDFRRLAVDDETDLYVLPGRSEHHQFCRTDSDCVQDGDRCYGRVCTTDITLTCRDLAETLGAPHRDQFYGSINGTTMMFTCRDIVDVVGFTLIGKFALGTDGWNRDNILECNPFSPGYKAYSILRLAETLRVSGSEPRFKILVAGQRKLGLIWSGFLGTVPTNQTLISHTDTGTGVDLRVEQEFNNYVTDNADHIRLPWLPPTGSALLSLMGPQDEDSYLRTMINTANIPHMDGKRNGGEREYAVVWYWIRE